MAGLDGRSVSARRAGGGIARWLVLAALGACTDEAKHPYLPRDEAAEQAARDCAAMTCEGAQVAIAQLVEEVSALAEAERVLLEEVERACLAVVVAAGATIEPVTSETPAERAAWACADAEAAVAALPGASVRGSAGSMVGCGSSLADVVACEQACACAGCLPRGVEATCSGAAVGRCDAACTGTCWPAEEGGTAACEGECFGRCEGTCSGSVDEGGTCGGVCTGRCSGPCAVRPGAEVRCDGVCDACSGGLEEARCVADRVERGWSVHEDEACSACSTRCVALAVATGPCLPVALRAIDEPPAGMVNAIVDVWVACLQLSLRSELRLTLSLEAGSLTSAGNPGSVCAGEQVLRIGELDPLPVDACWAVVFAAE